MTCPYLSISDLLSFLFHYSDPPLHALPPCIFILPYRVNRSILDDVRWLLSDIPSEDSLEAKDDSSDPWFGPVRHASDYFHTIDKAAVYLIGQGLAYVDDLSPGTNPLSLSFAISLSLYACIYMFVLDSLLFSLSEPLFLSQTLFLSLSSISLLLSLSLSLCLSLSKSK